MIGFTQRSQKHGEQLPSFDVSLTVGEDVSSVDLSEDGEIYEFITLGGAHKDRNSCFLGGEQNPMKKRQSERAPFQNVSNRSGDLTVDEKQHLLKRTALSLKKPTLKQNRISQQTRASEAQSICNSIIVVEKEEESTNLKLAQQLQNKVRLLDERIGAKLNEIKSQFWSTRAKSLLSRTNSLKQAEPVKMSLIGHLQKKHSACDPPQVLKNCYMKFIPMRSVLVSEDRPITNRKIVMSRLVGHLQKEFKCV